MYTFIKQGIIKLIKIECKNIIFDQRFLFQIFCFLFCLNKLFFFILEKICIMVSIKIAPELFNFDNNNKCYLSTIL